MVKPAVRHAPAESRDVRELESRGRDATRRSVHLPAVVLVGELDRDHVEAYVLSSNPADLYRLAGWIQNGGFAKGIERATRRVVRPAGKRLEIVAADAASGEDAAA